VRVDTHRLPLELVEGVGHDRHLACRLDDRPCDEMGEGELLPGRLERSAALVEDPDRHCPEARRRGDRSALVHEPDGRRRRAPDRLALGLGRRRLLAAGRMGA
jgi:hypothetical protein